MAFQSKTKNMKRSASGRFVPYEETNNILGIKMFVTIVHAGQANGIVKLLEEIGINYNVVTKAEGTGIIFLPNLIGENKKQVIFSFVREDNADAVRNTLQRRLSVSKAANGIAFSIKLTSVMGVSIYKWLTNTRKVTKGKK